MKTATLFAALVATAVASPLSKRGVTENEVENGECRTYTFIFARGSTEIGNMVRSIIVSSPGSNRTDVSPSRARLLDRQLATP